MSATKFRKAGKPERPKGFLLSELKEAVGRAYRQRFGSKPLRFKIKK